MKYRHRRIFEPSRIDVCWIEKHSAYPPTHLVPISCHHVQPRLETKLLEILTDMVTGGCEAPRAGRDVVHEKLGGIQEEHEVAVAVAVEVVAHVVHVVGDAAHLRPLQAPAAQPPQFNALAARVGAPALLDPHHLHAVTGKINLWASSLVEIRLFASPTGGYMLFTSSGFPLLNWGNIFFFKFL
jgi:hypothetical protein